MIPKMIKTSLVSILMTFSSHSVMGELSVTTAGLRLGMDVSADAHQGNHDSDLWEALKVMREELEVLKKNLIEKPQALSTPVPTSLRHIAKESQTMFHTTAKLVEFLVPVGDHILVRLKSIEGTSAGGIVTPLPFSRTSGEVISVGTGTTMLTKGDFVVLPEVGGTTIEVDLVEYLLIREDDIPGKF